MTVTIEPASDEQFSPERRPRSEDEEKGLVAWCEAGYRQGLDARRPYEPIALRSLLFWTGNQWSTVVADPVYEWTRQDLYPEGCEVARKVNNQIPTFTRAIMATMMQNMPRIECVPATSSEEDVASAGLATRWLRYRYREDNERKLRQGDLAQLFGVGETLRRTSFDAHGREGRHEGDLLTEPVHFFRYVKDPWSVGVWPPRFLVEYDARDVDWIKEHYGKEVKPEAVAAATDFEDRLAMNVFYSGATSREPLRRAAVLKRLYIAPNSLWPRGHCYVWANGVLLASHDLQEGRFPFARAAWLDVPMRLYPLGLVELLLADQRELNVLLSLMWESVVRQVRGDILTAGANQEGAREKILNHRTGAKQIMLPNGVTKYQFLNYSIDWRHAEITYNRLMTSLHEKAGANKPSLGQPTDRMHRVTELQLLREGDIQALSWHMANFAEDFLAETARQKVRLARRYVKDVRMFTLFGDREGTAYFRGSDFRDTSDVVALPVPYLTPAMKRQALVQATEMKLLPPYANKFAEYTGRRMLQELGLDDIEDSLVGVLGPMEELEKVCKFLGARQTEVELMLAGMREQLVMRSIQSQQVGGPATPAEMAAGTQEEPAAPAAVPV